jgi:hypothetical protein
MSFVGMLFRFGSSIKAARIYFLAHAKMPVSRKRTGDEADKEARPGQSGRAGVNWP